MKAAARAPIVAAGALLVARLAAPAGAAAPERVAFAFAPPVDRAFDLRAYGTATMKWGGNKEVVEVGILSRLAFARTATGYRLTEATRDIALAMDGELAKGEKIDLLRRHRLTRVLSGEGALERIEGARENFAAMIPLLEGESRKRAEERLRAGRFGEGEAAGWYETFEILAGQTLELGRDYWFRHAHPTDEGWVAYDVLFRLGPWEETPNGRLLRQRVAYLRGALLEVPSALELRPKVRGGFEPGRPGGFVQGYKVTGNASRLIDPSTLLVWREQLYRREEHEVRPIEEVGITFAVEERVDSTLSTAAD